MIRLIALDIDGTLLTSKREISPRTRAALHKAAASGCHIVLSTGRAFGSLQDVIEQAGCISFAVTSNGGGVFTSSGEQLYSNRMPTYLVSEVMRITNRFGIDPELYIRGQAYASARQLDSMVGWGVPQSVADYSEKTRVRVPNFAEFVLNSIDEIEGMDILAAPRAVMTSGLRERLAEVQTLAVSSSSKWYIDVNVEGITKAFGLSHLAEIIGVDKSEVIAFGDEENDREMLKYAGIGIAMANCSESIRDSADYITADNDSDGIEKALLHFGVI